MQIISAPPGPTTPERILGLLVAHYQGMTVKEISQQLNRPVSGIHHCLKLLVATRKVQARLSDDGKQWIYYLAFSPVRLRNGFEEVNHEL